MGLFITFIAFIVLGFFLLGAVLIWIYYCLTAVYKPSSSYTLFQRASKVAHNGQARERLQTKAADVPSVLWRWRRSVFLFSCCVCLAYLLMLLVSSSVHWCKCLLSLNPLLWPNQFLTSWLGINKRATILHFDRQQIGHCCALTQAKGIRLLPLTTPKSNKQTFKLATL